MLWIIGSVTLVIFGAVIMCILVMGARADAQLTSPDGVKSSFRPRFSGGKKFNVASRGGYDPISPSEVYKMEGTSLPPVSFLGRRLTDRGEGNLRETVS